MDVMTGMPRQAGIKNSSHRRMSCQPVGNNPRPLLTLLHPDFQRFQPAQDEPGILRSEYRAE